MKNKIKNVAIFLMLLLLSITIVGSIYYNKHYPKQDFDAILFYITAGVDKTSPDVVNSVIFACTLPVLAALALLILPTIKTKKFNLKITLKKKNKTIQLFPIKLTSTHPVLYILVIFIIASFIFIKCFYVDEYIKHRFQNTKIFEDYYIDASSVDLKFPNKKRNLILIIGESFENTVFKKENGGAWDYSIMPELETLVLENTNFSNSENVGGALTSYGTTYSAAGNVAITAGIPLKSEDIFADANKYTGNGKYLNGVTSLRRNIRK